MSSVFERVRAIRLTALLTCACMMIPGCGRGSLEYTEVKRRDEKITTSELEAFLRIIESLPDQKLPRLPRVYASSPDWDHSRTLPVNELVAQEENRLARHWSVDWLATHMESSHALRHALNREQLTSQQFVGLALTIGIAMSHNTLRDNQRLDEVIRKGEKTIAALRADHRPFNSISREGKHHVLRKAVAITRVDRARRLKVVPPENRALVAQHREELARIFPDEFTTNPLDSIADLLEERGQPFEELMGGPSDEQLDWDPAEAIRGTDPPDPQFTRRS